MQDPYNFRNTLLVRIVPFLQLLASSINTLPEVTIISAVSDHHGVFVEGVGEARLPGLCGVCE